MRERIAVVGLGLIGGSLARRLAVSHDVIGYDADPTGRGLARAAGLTVRDELAETLRDASVVFVAVPLSDLSTVVSQALSAGAVVSDVGSVKTPLYAAVRSAGHAGRFVGGHPMAGSERSGFGASDPGLYDGAAWVLCLEPDSHVDTWLRVARLVTGIGARVVPSAAADHDAAVAAVSHVPHLLAAALAATVVDAGPLALTLAAGSFRDGTRVAATAPELPTAMCRLNRAAVASALAEMTQRLSADPGPLIQAGHRARLAWEHRSSAPADIPVGAGLQDRLLDLGRAGGWVARVGEDTLSVVVPEPI